MTEFQKSYSIEKDLNVPASPEHIEKAGKGTIDGNEFHVPAVASQPHRINSKLILQNMEEVLHTVKKQHKEKHRRKKELKKLGMTGSATGVSSSMSNGDHLDAQEMSSHSDKKSKHRDKVKRHGRGRPLQEKSTVENGKVLQESPLKTGTILQHFQRTPKKETGVVAVDGQNDTNENIDKVQTTVKNPRVTNAFEVLMNARNKTIGSNTPGKDSPSPVVDKEVQGVHEKRKLKLQEWAEQKGGAKRKLEVEARAQYVEEQLEQRAKRFKHMLIKPSSPKTAALQNKPSTPKEKTGKNKEKGIEKKRRSKPRVRRISSVDSTESIEVIDPPADIETESFLAKLNSPTKKRDSLLGYFPKKDSSKDATAKQSSEDEKCGDKDVIKLETPRRTVKKRTYVSKKTAVVDEHESRSETDTPSGRPRRSCVGKARYDFDVEDNQTKDSANSRATPSRKTAGRTNESRSTKPSAEEDSDELIIVLDDSINMSTVSTNTTPQGTPLKLAPLFVRSLPKPSPDPEILKARRAFLQSGVPEKLRIEQEKQKQLEQTYEESTELFPKIAHIRQWTEEDKVIAEKALSYFVKLKTEESYLEYSPLKMRKGRARQSKKSNIGLLSECTHSDFQAQHRLKSSFMLEDALLPSLANKRAVIKNWKSEFERFPTFKCYNQMREKYRYFNAIDSAQDTEQVTESFVVTRRTRRSMELTRIQNEIPDEEYKPPATAPNGELMFSEKYKPLLFEQVLVNLNPVTQLKEFLSSWSTNARALGSAKNAENFDDSMDFNDSTSQGPTCNTVVLLGPVSSGKTNAVFALANEMNFNVLEINAGMKRTGKKLIQELQEATQSHQIRKDVTGVGSSQKNNLFKMSLNGLKSKTKQQNANNVDGNGSDSSNGEATHSDRKCLILIEDADIVFDQTDAGFTDAIYTLAASSKRPVIAVASNPNCSHLQRLMAVNTIHFPPQNVLNISRFLSVLSLIENCPVLLDDIISLYLYNKRDLRKTLLELQFFIQSGGDREKQLLSIIETQSQKDTIGYFASPRKRQFSTEQNNLLENQDINLPVDRKNSSDKANDFVYMHRMLFDFYTCCQNSKFRIPFPPDFRTFGVNLNDIFKVSCKLKENDNHSEQERIAKGATKRKSKSPKKQWLTNATKIDTALDNLCMFYENVSVASLMDQEGSDGCRDSPLSSSSYKTHVVDRINTNLSENISHTLLEMAIAVNLDASACPYNLFDTPKECIPLYKDFGTMQVRSKRTRDLDYEPCLRSICRSEKARCNASRRSTRFYHYLRTLTVNVGIFSSTPFDQVCEVFNSSEEDEQPTELLSNHL